MRPAGWPRLTLGTALALGVAALLLPVWRSPAAPVHRHASPLPTGLPMRCRGLVVSAGFRDPRYRRATGLRHDAVDLVCPPGTAVDSTIAGVVVFLGRAFPLGLTVWLQRGDTRVIYAHLSRLAALRLGGRARPGRLLGWEGDSGLTTGPHLLYEVEVDEPLARAVPPTHWPGHAINPVPTLGRHVPYAF